MIKITKIDRGDELFTSVHTHRIYDPGTNTVYMVTMDEQCAQMLQQHLEQRDATINILRRSLVTSFNLLKAATRDLESAQHALGETFTTVAGDVKGTDLQRLQTNSEAQEPCYIWTRDGKYYHGDKEISKEEFDAAYDQLRQLQASQYVGRIEHQRKYRDSDEFNRHVDDHL